jgi:hypothetical protein
MSTELARAEQSYFPTELRVIIHVHPHIISTCTRSEMGEEYSLLCRLTELARAEQLLSHRALGDNAPP